MPRAPLLILLAAAALAGGEAAPWGELRRHRIQLAPSPEEWPEAETRPTSLPWTFHEVDAAGAERLLVDAGVEPALARRALADATVGDHVVTVRPPLDVVLELPAAARGRIYGCLARWYENQDQVCAPRWTRPAFDRLMATAPIAPATVALMRRLSYADDELVAVADVPAACAGIDDVAERRRLLCAVVQGDALAVSLRLHAGGGDESAIRWWSAAGADVGRYLRALAARGEDIDVDIDQLLPPMPRERLNRYPLPDERRFDCGWTALNFFEARPRADLLEPAVVAETLRDQYRPVAAGEAWAYGDIVILALRDGRALHAAVYLADDLVYTKNGASVMRPWKVIDLATLRVRYHAAPMMTVLRANGR